MKLACIMPVGPNEQQRHLERVLRSARKWADVLIVYCDGCERATRLLAWAYANVCAAGSENLYQQAEHLVRNELLAMADRTLEQGDIVVALDADEEFAENPDEIRAILQSLNDRPEESWNVHFLHLWDPEGTVHRVDGAWQPSIGPRIYRHRNGYRLEPLYGSAWVCPPLPPHLLRTFGQPPLLDILHWSYARPEDRRPKYERYMRLPGHAVTHIRSILEEPTVEPVPCRSSS